jgi:hypothetical protein
VSIPFNAGRTVIFSEIQKHALTVYNINCMAIILGFGNAIKGTE